MSGENMSNATAQMVASPKVKPRNVYSDPDFPKPRRKKKKRWYRLRLVIDEVDNLDDAESKGYDLDNAKPWPLGHYDTESGAIAQRNAMVMIDPKSTGDPKKDKRISDSGVIHVRA